MAIPVTIITGFLGSGKTTLLNRFLDSDHGLSLAVLVNDFGSLNIDAQLVVDVALDDANLINLTNGCICCTIQGDLLQAIDDLLARDVPPDGIVIETSGITDPIDVVLLLRTIEKIRIDSVITVIDSEHILDIVGDARILAMNQIGTADLIVLNKTDLIDRAQLQNVHDFVAMIKPDTIRLETNHAQIPMALILGAGRFDPLNLPSSQSVSVHIQACDTEHPDHTHKTDHSLQLATWAWQHNEPMAYHAIKKMSIQLSSEVYRAKGIFFVAGHEDALLVQMVGKRIEMKWITPVWGDLPQSQFVVIGRRESLDQHRFQQRLDACLLRNQPVSLWQRVSNWASRTKI